MAAAGLVTDFFAAPRVTTLFPADAFRAAAFFSDAFFAETVVCTAAVREDFAAGCPARAADRPVRAAGCPAAVFFTTMAATPSHP